MNIDLIPVGDDPPDKLNVIIEVPLGGEPVKYEFDKKSGALFVDRILHTPMRYPANYGFIPHTLSPDGDPLDALVISRTPFISGSVVRTRPIAVLFLEDEAGGDEKLLTVPVDATFPYYADIDEREDLPQIVMQQVEHFFTHYKDLEPEKWVRVGRWGSAEEAREVVRESIERARLGLYPSAVLAYWGAMISQKTRYALRALLYLVELGKGSPVQLAAIAETQQVPRKYLELIMLDLKKAGIVSSVRGPAGGYRLARPPEDISFGEVIRVLDGPIALVPCASVNFYSKCGDCHDEATCAIRRIMMVVRDESARILESHNLAEAAGLEAQL